MSREVKMKTEKDFANSLDKGKVMNIENGLWVMLRFFSFLMICAVVWYEAAKTNRAEAKVKALKKILEEVEADRVSLIGDGFLGDKISAKVDAILTEKNL